LPLSSNGFYVFKPAYKLQAIGCRAPFVMCSLDRFFKEARKIGDKYAKFRASAKASLNNRIDQGRVSPRLRWRPAT
jgi:hypothetical protein